MFKLQGALINDLLLIVIISIEMVLSCIKISMLIASLLINRDFYIFLDVKPTEHSFGVVLINCFDFLCYSFEKIKVSKIKIDADVFIILDNYSDHQF